MRLQIDDVRPAPDGYVWCKSVNEAKALIEKYNKSLEDLTVRVKRIGLVQPVQLFWLIQLLDPHGFINFVQLEGGKIMKSKYKVHLCINCIKSLEEYYPYRMPIEHLEITEVSFEECDNNNLDTYNERLATRNPEWVEEK